MHARPIAAPLLGLLAAACHDSSSGPADPCVLRATRDCDVREAECQEHVYAVLACIRDVELPLPEIEVLSAGEYAEKHPPPPPRTAEEQRRYDQTARAYQLLGWLPADWSEPTSVPEVAAPYFSYDFETDVVTIIADRKNPDAELYGLLYALGLAARDRESDIHGLLATAATTFDSKRALTTLYAGEATLYADLAWFGDPDYDAGADAVSYTTVVSEVRRWFGDVEVPWGAAISSFAFYFGADAMLRAYRDGGPAAVDAAYDDDAYASTAYVLGGDLDLDAAFSAIDTALPEPPEGFQYIVEDSYGPVMLHMHRLRVAGSASTAAAEQTLAREWIGDRFVIAAGDDDERVAVVWQIAGSGGQVADTIVLASDDATLAEFEALFVTP